MRVIAKIGTSSITDGRGAVDDAAVQRLCAQVAGLRRAGHEVVVVTSGAVAAGVAALGLRERPADAATLQALSAVGMPRLLMTYDRMLAGHGLVPAQVLLTPLDFVDRNQYLHARQTLERLLDLGCVPVVNENDAVADDEIRFGDNDRIAALVANLLTADLLVLLTDTPGLYTADPRHDPTARLIPVVDDIEAVVRAAVVGGAGSTRGSGGMASKLQAARIAAWSGVRAVIAKADRPGVLHDAVAGGDVGTTFVPKTTRLNARKLWIAFARTPEGRVVVDDGARAALVARGVSLLPAGVVSVDGTFDAGAAVEIAGTDGVVFARGIAATDDATVRANVGRHTSFLPDGVPHEVVHRDDFVALPA
jgi:glutamate 5-kinase